MLGLEDAEHLGQAASRCPGGDQATCSGRPLCALRGEGPRTSSRGPSRLPRGLSSGDEKRQRRSRSLLSPRALPFASSAVHSHHKPARAGLTGSYRRTKVIPPFLTERACLKLVFFALWKTSQRWRAMTTTELERQQPALLRQELGLPLCPGQETHVRGWLLTPRLWQEVSDLTNMRDTNCLTCATDKHPAVWYTTRE